MQSAHAYPMHIILSASFAGALQQVQCAPLECSLKCEIIPCPPLFHPLLDWACFDCILPIQGAWQCALNSPLLQSTASQTKCSRRVAAYAKLLSLPTGFAWDRLQVAHAHGKRLHYPLEIQLRFVFYFALECAPGREAQQDADALTAHDAAGQRVNCNGGAG